MEKKKYNTPAISVFIIDSEELLDRFGGTGSTDPSVRVDDEEFDIDNSSNYDRTIEID